MGLTGILLGLALLIGLAYRGWSVLLLAPAAGLVAAAFAGEPLLAHWTQTFMGSAARFVAQFFPIFLLGALFGKLMDDSGSARSIAAYIGAKLGARRAILAVVIAFGLWWLGLREAAALPLAVVVNLLMSMVVLPRLDLGFLADEQWGPTSLASVGGVWSVVVALVTAIVVLVVLNRARLGDLRASMDAGANASVLPVVSVASLVGFGAVIAALPAFELVPDWVLSIEGGPLVSLAVSTNVLAALTGSAAGGLTIALVAVIVLGTLFGSF